MSRRSICVYAGSSPGVDNRFQAGAEQVGRDIAAAGLRLVYGGGGLGLMGACARAAFENGGEVLGVIPSFLVGQERPIAGIPTVAVESMHERKRRMLQEAQGCIALPGGVGTLEELVETLSWARLGLHAKPVILADLAFWEPLTALFSHTIGAGFTPTRFNECWQAAPADQAVAIALEAMTREADPLFDPANLT